MAEILVLANETIVGQKVLDAIRERAEEGDAHFHVVVPLTRPRHGNVVYDDVVRDSAQVRVDLAVAFMRDGGIDGSGEVGDSDPLNAAKDAVAEHGIDEIIVSTLPATQSAWLKRDLIGDLQSQTGLPVNHIVVDLTKEGLPFEVTLVVANQTVASPELLSYVKERAEDGPRRFVIIVPQDSGEGTAVKEARARLRTLLRSLRAEKLLAGGMIGHPDPYIAVMNAIDFFHLSEIVISTLPEAESKWVADKLVERVQKSTSKPVKHIASSAETVNA